MSSTLDVAGKLIEAVKLPARFWVGVGVVAAFVAVAPEGWTARLGFDAIPHFRTGAGAALCVSAVTLVAALAGKVAAWFQKQRRLRERFALFEQLAPDQKALLREFLERDVSTLRFPHDGVAEGLVTMGILHRPMSIGSVYRQGFAYTLMPWARDYLLASPHVLLDMPTLFTAGQHASGEPSP